MTLVLLAELSLLLVICPCAVYEPACALFVFHVVNVRREGGGGRDDGIASMAPPHAKATSLFQLSTSVTLFHIKGKLMNFTQFSIFFREV